MLKKKLNINLKKSPSGKLVKVQNKGLLFLDLNENNQLQHRFCQFFLDCGNIHLSDKRRKSL